MLASPTASFAAGLIVGAVLILFRLPRLGRLVVALAIAQLIVLSFQPVADALMLPLEDEGAPRPPAAPACCYDAIVVLGGGIGPAVPPLRPDPELFDSSDRVWHAARLFHRGLAPRIIVSGGSFRGDRPGAGQRRPKPWRCGQFLLALGVPGGDRERGPLAEHDREHAGDRAPWSARAASRW